MFFSHLPSTTRLACAIALINAVVPLLAVCGAYAIGLAQQVVPVCNPFIEGCTSISRAARSGDAIYWFRFWMMPLAPCILVYWYLQRHWLSALVGTYTRGIASVFWLNVFAAIALLLYVDFLGSDGPFYEFMRRQGVMFYFGLTAIAQLLSIHAIYRIWPTLPRTERRAVRVQWLIVVAQWVLGLASVANSAWQPPFKSEVNNVLEWWFALFMVSYYGASVWLWAARPPAWEPRARLNK